MEYITINPRSYYNPDYFNILEQLEYELLLYEHMAITEAFTEVLEDVHGVSSVQQQSAPSKLRALANRTFGEKNAAKGQTFFNRIHQYFTLIITKIKEITQKFMNKVNELVKANDNFVKNKLHLLDHVDGDFWKTVEITTYPYKKDLLNDNIYGIFSVPRIDANNNTLKEMLSDTSTKEELLATYFKKLERYQGPNEGIKEAAKNFFRGVDSSDAKMVKYTGDDAQKRCTWMRDYLQSYKTSTAQAIQNHMKELQGATERAQKDFETNKLVEYSAKKESYIPSLEAQVKVDPSKTNDRNGTVSDTDDLYRGAEQNKPGGENNTGNRIFSRMKDYENILMALHTAQMTIAEEYYYASLNILRGVYNKAEKQGNLDVKAADKAKQQEDADKARENVKARQEIKKAVKNGSKGNPVKVQNQMGTS